MAPRENLSLSFINTKKPHFSCSFQVLRMEILRTKILILALSRFYFQIHLCSLRLVCNSHGRVFTLPPSSGLLLCIQTCYDPSLIENASF